MEFPFERQAMQGKPLPLSLDVADSCLYMALKNLYAMYYNNLIDRKSATEEKQRLIYNWTLDKSRVDFLSRNALDLNERIRNASRKYKENPCVETADLLYAAFYNLSENWRQEK